MPPNEASNKSAPPAASKSPQDLSPPSEAKSRLFAIGDIHGCASELEQLIVKMRPTTGDVVVFLGDYIDRGPDAKGVIDLILDLRSRCEVVCLKGNHEEMFLDFLERPASRGAGLFILNGGSATLASYAGGGGSFEIPREHIEFLYSLKISYEKDGFFFVHAGVPNQPLRTLTEEHESLLLWSREPFLSSQYDWGKVIVHGHTPVGKVDVRKNRINLDTGCVYEGSLTAMEFPSRAVYDVRRSSSYKESVRQLTEADSRIAVRFEGFLPLRAGRIGEASFDFETLNYNQFGLLMRETTVREIPLLRPGDKIAGIIGLDPGRPDARDPVEFTGDVVRSETRGGAAVYAVSIERITDGSEGRRWIDRPDETETK
jgi:serine/threonine protein phosphatase 1